MILAWKASCDVCGFEQEVEPGQSLSHPEGWLTGSFNLNEAGDRGGEFYGQICARCRQLSIHQLLTKRAQMVAI